MTYDDVKLIKRLYGLSDEQVSEAKKLFSRSTFSVCKSAKIVKGRQLFKEEAEK